MISKAIDRRWRPAEAGADLMTTAPLTAAPRPARMLAITAAWGACFIVIRWGLRDAPVLWFAALRSLGAGAALLALAMLQRRPTPRGRPAWSLIALLGITNGSIAFGAMFAGVAGLATGTAAVLSNAQPLLILLPAWWLYGEVVTPRMTIFLLVGFAGLLAVAVPGGGGQGAALSIVAAVAVTSGTLLARRAGHLDVVMVSAWHFLIGGALLAAVAGAVEGVPAIDWTPRFVGSLAFLTLVGTAAAFVLWFEETQRCALGRLAAWTFLVPVFGITLGSWCSANDPGGGRSQACRSCWDHCRCRCGPHRRTRHRPPRPRRSRRLRLRRASCAPAGRSRDPPAR